MAIVRWEPFRDLVTIQDRMNRIFDDAFRGSEEQAVSQGRTHDQQEPAEKNSGDSSEHSEGNQV